jgi:hypothetical protein
MLTARFRRGFRYGLTGSPKPVHSVWSRRSGGDVRRTRRTSNSGQCSWLLPTDRPGGRLSLPKWRGPLRGTHATVQRDNGVYRGSSFRIKFLRGNSRDPAGLSYGVRRPKAAVAQEMRLTVRSRNLLPRTTLVSRVAISADLRGLHGPRLTPVTSKGRGGRGRWVNCIRQTFRHRQA